MTTDTATTFLHLRQTPCLARLNAQRPWVRTVALHIGDMYVGVRANSEATAEAVATLFGDVRAPEVDAAAPANFSVEIAPADSQNGRRGLHLVYHDHEIVARRRDPEQLLLDLVELVEATAHAGATTHLAVRASAIVDPDDAVTLLPPQWHRPLVVHQQSLTTHALELLPTDTHLLDWHSGELVVRPAGPVARGRHRRSLPVRAWGVRTLGDEERALRRAVGVQAAFLTVANVPAAGAKPVLLGLRQIGARTRFVGVPAMTGADAVATARRLALTDGRDCGGNQSRLGR